jgi:hypothetical protein
MQAATVRQYDSVIIGGVRFDTAVSERNAHRRSMFRMFSASVPAELRPAGDDLFVHGEIVHLYAEVCTAVEPAAAVITVVAETRLLPVLRRHAGSGLATIASTTRSAILKMEAPLQQVMWRFQAAGAEIVVIVH